MNNEKIEEKEESEQLKPNTSAWQEEKDNLRRKRIENLKIARETKRLKSVTSQMNNVLKTPLVTDTAPQQPLSKENTDPPVSLFWSGAAGLLGLATEMAVSALTAYLLARGSTFLYNQYVYYRTDDNHYKIYESDSEGYETETDEEQCDG